VPGAPLRFVGREGVALVGESWGDRDAPAVVFLHGGGQTRHAWGGTARRVAAHGWRAIVLDARGHGDSDWSPTGDYRLESFADDLQRVLRQVGATPVLVGASLGGLTTMLLLGEVQPGAARGVVLVDIVPDMEQTGALRVHGFMLERARTGFASIEEVATAVGAYNTHRPAPADVRGLRKNLRERDGRLYWHWDPSFMDASTGQLPSEIGDVDRMHRAVARMVADAPVMLVRGRASDLVSERKAAEFVARFPSVEFVDVTGAGHMVAGDRNDAFTDHVLAYLDALATNGRS
jgi:peroxiredoxin